MKKRFLSICLCTAVLFSGCASSKTSTGDTATDQTAADDTAAATKAATEPSLDSEEPSGNADDNTYSNTDPEEKKPSVAIAMPGKPSGDPEDDAENMKRGLEAKGYTVEIQYAEDNARRQAQQIEDFAASKADCIVIEAVDPGALTEAARAAADAKIPVIAYDDLLMDTDAVSFYMTFDHKGTGTMMGRTIVEKAGLDSLAGGEYKTIEFFMGSAEDDNSLRLYNGLMEVLQPYLDNGTLVCNTERISFEDTCILETSETAAKERCENYLAGYYAQEDLDICVAAVDRIAYGCKEAFLAAGYTDDNWPVISGQDCEPLACKNILDGTQAFSICKDSRVLAEKCVSMVDAVLNGMAPEINDTEQYNNHVMQVPAYMCAPVVIDQANLQEIMIDGGYYTEEEIDSAK